MMLEELDGYCFSLAAFSSYNHQLVGKMLDIDPNGSHFSGITSNWFYQQKDNLTQC